MGRVVEFVLRTSAGDEVVQGTHLGCHVVHLSVYYTDSLFVHRFRGRLDSGVMLADRLKQDVSI